jgi:hypothetical protein
MRSRVFGSNRLTCEFIRDLDCRCVRFLGVLGRCLRISLEAADQLVDHEPPLIQMGQFYFNQRPRVNRKVLHAIIHISIGVLLQSPLLRVGPRYHEGKKGFVCIERLIGA